MTLDDLLKGLNENQRRAVESTEGRVRVAAGAGSGKTRVLTLRYAYIVQKLGVTPEHILSVTFTNKAAREMRDRIRALMPDGDGGWILTFHGACHKILKEEIGFFAYPENFMVMDEEDQKSVLQRIFSQKGFTLKDFSFRDCMNAIEEYKAFADYVPFLTDVKRAQKAPALDEEKNKLDAVIAAYLDMQRKNYWLDFADLIQFTLYLFKVSSSALQKWQNKFEYVQIDEFQDVSGEQYKLARALAGKHKNLFIVGDPDQTIYSWRGADVGFFNNFDKFLSDAKTIVLDENYRSTPEILAVSNALISKNEDRIEKSLKATRPHGEKPLYHHAKSRIDEADAIADKILELKKTGALLSDIAVLYRGNYLSRVIETSFVKKGVPYVVFSGTAFYQRKEIKDALAYLRLSVFGDDLSFERVVNTPHRGIGATRRSLLRAYAEENDCSLAQALGALALTPRFKGTGAGELLHFLIDAQAFAAEHDPAETLDHVLQKSGYEEFLRLSGGQDRLDNLSELKASVREFVESEGDDASVRDYLNSISLLTSADAEEKKDCVKLMTVHTAKGLEFPYVFVSCLNEGLFPSRKIKNIEEMQEERRVAYVALTRAQKRLFLSDAEGYDAQAGGAMYTSRFIFEIGKDLLQTSGKFSLGHLARSKAFISSHLSGKKVEKSGFCVGEKVFHPVFGVGSIAKAEADAYLVLFESGKTRSIAATSDILKPL